MAKNTIEFDELLDDIIKLEKEMVVSMMNGNTLEFPKLFDEQFRKKLILKQMYNELN